MTSGCLPKGKFPKQILIEEEIGNMSRPSERKAEKKITKFLDEKEKPATRLKAISSLIGIFGIIFGINSN